MAKKKAKKARILILPSGAEFEITGENGKYWICGNTQFRKALGYAVTELVTKKPNDAAQDERTDA